MPGHIGPLWPFVLLPVIVTDAYAALAFRDMEEDRLGPPGIFTILPLAVDVLAAALLAMNGWKFGL
jgi:hypothetical protein